MERLSRQKITDRLFESVDCASLVVFRIAFGLIMLWEVFRYFDHGWIERYWITPDFHFQYFGFEWVKPWSGNGMYLHFVGLGVLAVCITIGFLYRLATALFFLGFTYVFLLDQSTYLNHFYLICILSFVMMFVPAHRAFSFDALLKITPNRSSKVPFWSVALVAFVIAIPYFFGGVAKLNTDWLQGEPMRSWLHSRQNFPVIGTFFDKEWAVYAFSYGGLLFDLLVVPLLLWKPTRKLAFAAAVMFHLMNAKMFSIGIFPWFMIAATPIFFHPSWPRRFFRGPLRRWRTPETESPEGGAVSFPKNRVIPGALAAFALFQILFPMRHLLYSGNVNWTEEGHRFAWHMKLRDKNSTAFFHVTDPATGKNWKIDPKRILSSRQARKMPSRPDMVLQFSHHIAEEFQKIGYPDVEVRATVSSSLNGRKQQLLIHPGVNLAKEKRSLGKVAWIKPLEIDLK